jgi:hypothetical protein
MTAPRKPAPGAAPVAPTAPRPASPWRPPTRRAFVAALGAAAAALAARSRGLDLIALGTPAESERETGADRPHRLTTRWVGHC